MAEGNVEIPLPWGGKISASGPIVILLIVLLAANGAVIYLATEAHHQQTREHAELLNTMRVEHCTVVLDLWAHTTTPRGQALDYDKMPSVLWNCMPEFLHPKK